MDRFKGFSQPVLRMLDMAPEDGVIVWDLMDMELQPRLVSGKAVLIGDAAHPFLPCRPVLFSHSIRAPSMPSQPIHLLTCAPHTDLGQGAAQAIEDGCALGAVLPLGTNPEDVPQRLELWQRLRRDRAQKIVLDTRHRGREADGSEGPPQTGEWLLFVFFGSRLSRELTRETRVQSKSSTRRCRSPYSTMLGRMAKRNSKPGWMSGRDREPGNLDPNPWCQAWSSNAPLYEWRSRRVLFDDPAMTKSP